MKELKKTLSMLLLAAMVFTCCLSVSLAEELVGTTDTSIDALASGEAVVLSSDEVETEQEETLEPEYPDEVETPVEPETPVQPEEKSETEGETKSEAGEEPEYPGDVDDPKQDETTEETPDGENAKSDEDETVDAETPNEEEDEVASDEASEEEQTEVSDEEAEEAVEDEEEPEEELVEEIAPVFSEGYAIIGTSTTVYETASVSSEMGNINAGGAVYVTDRMGDGESDSDWLEIVFAAVQNGKVEIMTGYVRARAVNAVAEEEVTSLTAWLSTTNAVEHNGWLLQPLAFISNIPVVEETPAVEDEAEEEPELDLSELLNPERHVVMRANWNGEEIHFGESLELQAVPVGYDNAVYTLQWQTKAEGGEWQDVEGETDSVFTCEVTEDNYLNQWRVLLTVTGVEIVADAE